MNILRPGTNDLHFPPVETSTPEGLVAIGGDLRPERLLAAYRHGIFPWYSDNQPILWWSPDPRTVLFPAKLNVSHSLRKTLRQGKFRVSLDQAFGAVMRACAGPRGNQPSGTWITPEMLDAYVRLHALGYAHSVEAWDDGKLVGGLYGVALGTAFFGESMFSRATDASKVAFVHLVRQLEAWGYTLVDCQVASAHLFSLGAEEIPRADFLARLAAALARPGRPAPWRFDSDLEVA
jgi:leucyl/phenylalanyl-tRNA--protein transferase